MATINISNLYQEAFGIKPKYLVPRRGAFDFVASPDYKGIEVWEEEQSDFITELGTPVLERISLEEGRYQSFQIKDGIQKPESVRYTGYDFPNWPMIDVSQDKVIVTTAINGREGTIKEYIYSDDYQINIRGVLVGDGNTYPYEARKALANVFKVNNAYGIVSRVLNDMGIYAIVMKSLSFTDLEGYNNVCTYTISALSDLDVLLTIKDKLKK